MLLNADFLRSFYDQAVDYETFVASGEAEGHRMQWDERYGRLALTPEQETLVRSFIRGMPVLCLTGTWCGDCALQGAAMQRIAEANDRIQLRFLPRSEEFAPLVVAAQLNQGFRVPITWFMAEDFAPVARMGDRTLSRYRSMARKALGDEAVQATAPADPVREVLNEVLDEFERAHLILRTSARLREKYGD